MLASELHQLQLASSLDLVAVPEKYCDKVVIVGDQLNMIWVLHKKLNQLLHPTKCLIFVSPTFKNIISPNFNNFINLSLI